MRIRTVTLAAAATAFAAIALFAAAGAVFARNDYIPVPAAYRYTGIAGTLASAASHAIFVGDGVSVSFSDKATPPVKAYRLCLYKNGSSSAVKCWQRRILARNYDRDRFTVLSLPMGESVASKWVAKWYVARRIVATWRFVYLQEGE